MRLDADADDGADEIGRRWQLMNFNVEDGADEVRC